jgi:hypothetical protein
MTLPQPIRSELAHCGAVDVVALASVITSGVLGIGSLWTAVWSTRKNVQLAREQRVQQRLGEAYLELLRLVEREGQWVRSRATASSRTVRSGEALADLPAP